VINSVSVLTAKKKKKKEFVAINFVTRTTRFYDKYYSSYICYTLASRWMRVSNSNWCNTCAHII